MEALDVETSRAEGEQALQALITFVRENAGKLAAHEAEKGIFKRLLPIGLAAMKLYFAQRGPGDVGPAVTRADGMLLPREQKLRGLQARMVKVVPEYDVASPRSARGVGKA